MRWKNSRWEFVDDKRLGFQAWVCLKSWSGAPFMHAPGQFAKTKFCAHTKKWAWYEKSSPTPLESVVTVFLFSPLSCKVSVDLGIFRRNQWSLRNNKTIHSNKSDSVIPSDHMLMILRLLLLPSSSWMDCQPATFTPTPAVLGLYTWTRNNRPVYGWYVSGGVTQMRSDPISPVCLEINFFNVLIIHIEVASLSWCFSWWIAMETVLELWLQLRWRLFTWQRGSPDMYDRCQHVATQTVSKCARPDPITFWSEDVSKVHSIDVCFLSFG